MQKMYDLVLLTNYIDGKITDRTLLKKLENDPVFMKMVISTTNNKEIYTLCSEKVRRNFNFVKFIVYHFRDDKEFITSVADYFLMKSNNNDRFELSIIMAELIGKPNNKYELLSESLFKLFNTNVEIIKSKLEEDDIAKSVDGFSCIKIKYSSKIILDYCAKKMAIRIVSNENDLEKYLHKIYKSFEPIKRNPKKVLIDFLRMYDRSLAQYFALDPNLLSCLNNILRDIESGFDSYFATKEEEKHYLLIKRLEEYSKTHEPGLLSFEEIILYASMRLEILEKMLEYYNFRSSNYSEMIKNSEEILRTSLTDIIHYENIIKIIQTTLNNQDNNQSSKSVKGLGRILKLRV